MKNWGSCKTCGRPLRYAFGEGRLHCTGCEVPPSKCSCPRLYETVMASEVAADPTHRLDAEYWTEKKAGQRARDTGMARVEQRLEDEPWRQEADLAIKRLAASGQPFSAEDVTRLAGRPVHPNAVGARLSGWKRKGLIEPVGYQQAVRKSRHASRMLLWRGTISFGEAVQLKFGEMEDE